MRNIFEFRGDDAVDYEFYGMVDINEVVAILANGSGVAFYLRTGGRADIRIPDERMREYLVDAFIETWKKHCLKMNNPDMPLQGI